MRKLTLAVLALGLTTAAVAAPASAGQAQRVPTTVHFYSLDPSDQPPPRAARLFTDARAYGRVTAGKAKCARLRKLDLYERRDGPDFKLGSGYTDTRGYWSINTTTQDFDTGVLYAKAPRAKRGQTVCKPDRSPNLVLT